MGSKIALRAAAGDRFEAKVTELRPLGEFAVWRAARAVGDHDVNNLLLRADPDWPDPQARAGHDGVDRRGARRPGAVKRARTDRPSAGFGQLGGAFSAQHLPGSA